MKKHYRESNSEMESFISLLQDFHVDVELEIEDGGWGAMVQWKEVIIKLYGLVILFP